MRICICMLLVVGLTANVDSNAQARQSASPRRVAALPALLWTGDTSANWNTLSNWSPAQSPSGLVDCIIPAGRSRYPVISGSSSSAVCGGALIVESGANVELASGASLRAESVHVGGTLRLGTGTELSAATEAAVAVGGRIEQQGTGRVDILFRGLNGTVKVEGTLAIEGPLQISGASGTGRLLVMPGGLVQMNETAKLGVMGSLLNYGAMQHVQAVNPASDVRFLHVTSAVDGSGTMRYEGVEITPSFATPLGMTTVTVWGNQPCDSSEEWGRKTVLRCYQISPSTPAKAYVTFYFRQMETNLQKNPVPYIQGTKWTALPGSTIGGSGDGRFVKIPNVVEYGKFALFDIYSTVNWTYFPGVLR
jgi:hypothetical protein